MTLENSVSLQYKKMTDQKVSLLNILTCSLCLSKAKMAHICPTCSKIYCGTCIKTWIQRGNHYCVQCKAFIDQTNIVKFSQQFFNALQGLIQLQTPQISTCKFHNTPKTYYCSQCKLSICSDCIVLDSHHTGHKIQKLKKVKIQFNQQILSFLSRIKNVIKSAQTLKQQSNLKKNFNNKKLKNKCQQLNNYLQKTWSNYQQLITLNINRCTDLLQKTKLSHLSKQKTYEQYAKSIKQMPKIYLVRQHHQLQQLLQNLILQSSPSYPTNPELQNLPNTDPIIQNIITSKYAQQTYILSNYTQKRQKKQPIYSDLFTNSPLTWRLKIYPNGLEKKRETSGPVRQRLPHLNFGEEYISIYIELVSGVRQGGRYRFSIQILNESDESKVISQVYEADFDTGKCWGYNEFANISTLYQKGYVNSQDDSIKIAVSVGPPSYYYSTIDQQAMIAKRQQVIFANKAKIQLLRNKLHLSKNSQNQQNSFQQHHQQPSKQQPQNQQLSQPSSPQIPLKPTQPQQQLSQTKAKGSQKIKQQIKSPVKNKTQTEQNSIQDQIDFEHFVVQQISKNQNKSNQQLNYQAAELRKIFKRFTHLNQKNHLLLF